VRGDGGRRPAPHPARGRRAGRAAERPHLPQGGTDSAKATNGAPTALAESIVHEARKGLTVGVNPDLPSENWSSGRAGVDPFPGAGRPARGPFASVVQIGPLTGSKGKRREQTSPYLRPSVLRLEGGNGRRAVGGGSVLRPQGGGAVCAVARGWGASAGLAQAWLAPASGPPTPWVQWSR